MYYRHRLPSPEIESVTITDLAGNKVTEGWVLRESDILHSFKGEAYWVSYYENRMPQRRMLLYTPVIRRGIKAGAEIYTITTGGLLTVASAAATYRYTVHSAEWIHGDSLLRK